MSDSLRPHGLYVACETPLSVEFSRKEYWSGLPFPPPGAFSHPSIEAASLVSLCVICQDLNVICSFFFVCFFKLVLTLVPIFILIIFDILI